MFTIFTQENCPNCSILKGFMKEKNIQYTELDVNNSCEARAKMIFNDIETTPAISYNDNMFGGDLEVLKSRIMELNK